MVLDHEDRPSRRLRRNDRGAREQPLTVNDWHSSRDVRQSLADISWLGSILCCVRVPAFRDHRFHEAPSMIRTRSKKHDEVSPRSGMRCVRKPSG